MPGRRRARGLQGKAVLQEGSGAAMKLLARPRKSSSDLEHVRCGGANGRRGLRR